MERVARKSPAQGARKRGYIFGSQSEEDAILNANKPAVVEYLHKQQNSGRVVGPGEARMLLMDELAKGRKVLPTGPCEGFSYDAGCPGHDDAEVQDASL